MLAQQVPPVCWTCNLDKLAGMEGESLTCGAGRLACLRQGLTDGSPVWQVLQPAAVCGGMHSRAPDPSASCGHGMILPHLYLDIHGKMPDERRKNWMPWRAFHLEGPPQAALSAFLRL